KKSIKTMAAESLAMIGGEDVFKFLMDEFNKRNVSVIGALGIMKDERAVRPLLERLNDLFCEEHDAIRLALDNIRNKNSHDVGAEVNNLILKLILKQNNSGMKEMDLIISELRKIGTKKARFFAYLDEHRRNKYKDFMMSTFIDAESSSWVKEILENYNNYTDTPILYNAFRLLPEFKNADEFIPALINILRSTEDRELKWGYVADALGRIGDESALKELESQMRLIEELIAKSSENDVRYWEQYLYVVESAISRILGRKTNLAVGAGIDQNTIQFVKQSI
ncbi:MAG: hypothetical protein L6416_10700, partial [Candidatus Omnitrophica bacterium]|nr:hypothetical protein [Candidatus Omnitrophota bacterium]